MKSSSRLIAERFLCEKGKHGRVAVKVIDDRGIESLRIETLDQWNRKRLTASSSTLLTRSPRGIGVTTARIERARLWKGSAGGGLRHRFRDFPVLR
jgi:hypothetical protein